MPKWGVPRETCNTGFNSRFGQRMEFQMCTDWAGGDVKDCLNNKPEGTIGWQACGIGSSPTGEPGHSAVICSQPTESFSCKWGQNCFAMTKKEWNFDCILTNLGTIGSSILCCILIVFLIRMIKGRRQRRMMLR